MRVYLHVFYSHYEVLEGLDLDVHFNTSFQHFIFFVTEYELVPKKELSPFSVLIDSITSETKQK